MVVGRSEASSPHHPTMVWVVVMIAVVLIGAFWMVLLLKLGVAAATLRPGEGVLSNTFNGWVAHPEARRLFLAQYGPNDLAQGRAYTTYPYPFLLAMYLLVEPFHWAFGLPYEIAHNVSAYFHVICLSLLLVLVTRHQLLDIFATRSPFYWMLAFLCLGTVVTNPLPWVSLLLFNRESFHILSAAAFCYLSIWVFRNSVPRTPLVVVGLFLALWSPLYVPAWILTVVFFNKTLVLQRRQVLQVIGVSALAGFNQVLPGLVSRWAGYTPGGSPLSYRSGLDGSTQYMTSIFQAIFFPFDPRRWPIGLYLVTTVLLSVCCYLVVRKMPDRRPLQQMLFLTIPYVTIAIGFPQFTSIHPYLADILLLVPAAFLMAFWSLQKECWQSLTGRTYVAWLLVVSLVLMTNLLTVAQNMNRAAASGTASVAIQPLV